MINSLPDQQKYTCLVSAGQQDNEKSIHIHKVGKNGRLATRSLSMRLSGPCCAPQEVKQALKYLGGCQIVHFSEARVVEDLNRVIMKAGFSSIDNDIHDAALIVEEMCQGGRLHIAPDLDTLAEIHGLSPKMRRRARKDPRTRIRILQKAWTLLILPELGYFRTLAAQRAPRRMTPVEMSRYGLPLPAPEVAESCLPAAGWRRTAWGDQEARECALRFVEGAQIEVLSSLFRRSPRAIRARLILDGIIEEF